MIFNSSEEEHNDHVKQVMQILLENHIRINMVKSTFAVLELKYLGFILSQLGIRANPEKIQGLLAIPPPTSVLGSMNFFRCFVPDLATILVDVTALTSSKVPFTWNQELQNSLDTAKQLLARQTLLVYPDFTKEFHLYCDATDLGLGVVVVQFKGDIPQPIYFYSRKFNDTQKDIQ